MKVKLLVGLLFSIGLSSASSVCAETIQETESRIDSIFHNVVKHKSGGHSYTLVYNNVPVAQSNGYTIRINPSDCNTLTNDMIAFILGHEMGHIDSFQRISYLVIPSRTWNNEYEADSKGMKYMQQAGYSMEIAYTSFQILGPSTNTHPDYILRKNALVSGNRVVSGY